MPDAIVALVHANGWVLARRLAEQLDIPLHLIVHDGPDHFHQNYPILGRFMREEFLRACRQAVSRWSICTALDHHIEKMTGIPGDVLPPLRRADDISPKQGALKGPANHAVYFGALSSVSITSMMNDAARELARHGGILHAYGGVSPNVAASAAWNGRQFVHHGAFRDRDQFLEQCRQSYGFMYLPFSFEDENIQLSFPSKLVDYTLPGLPILVQAPANSPLGVWCHEFPDAVLFVSECRADALRMPIEALVGSAEFRSRLTHEGLKAGARYFGFERNWKRFVETVSTSTFNHKRAS